jgi:hypothetical protein
MILAELDMHGAVSGEDAAGHRIEIHFNGAYVTLDFNSIGSALAALSAMRQSRANGTLTAIGPLAHLGVSRIRNLQVELRIRGVTVARAGQNVSATWLGRMLTRLPIEIHWTNVLRVALRRRSSSAAE